MTNNSTHASTTLTVLDPESIPVPSQILVLFGSPAKIHALVLESLCLRAQRGERTGLILGDNLLQEYTLARLMRGYGYDPAILLAQIEYSRAFTCVQLLHSLRELTSVRARQWSGLYVLGLLETFYDEDLPDPLVSQVLDQVLTQLRQLANQGLSILVTLGFPPAKSSRGNLVERVQRAADQTWEPMTEPAEFLEAIQEELW